MQFNTMKMAILGILTAELSIAMVPRTVWDILRKRNSSLFIPLHHFCLWVEIGNTRDVKPKLIHRKHFIPPYAAKQQEGLFTLPSFTVKDIYFFRKSRNLASGGEKHIIKNIFKGK